VTVAQTALVRRGLGLTYLTLAIVALEALVALLAGRAADSTALLGFGGDSLIELVAAGAALWRLRAHFAPARRERVELLSLRTVGVCFLALSAFVAYEAVETLLLRERPRESPTGIALAVFCVIAMPLLARAKRGVAHGTGSGALLAESRQTSLCGYLSAILLAGLLLNAALGWWWADSVAALLMVPLIAWEGIEALRGRDACACGTGA